MTTDSNGDQPPTQSYDGSNKEKASALRVVVICVAVFASIAWACISIGSYPIIVPADSDLGTGAMRRVRDAGGMFLTSLGILVVSCRVIPFSLLRVTVVIGLLAFLAVYSFESSTFSHAARWPLMGLIGLLLVVEFLGTRQSKHRIMQSLFAIGIPILLILTDYQGRIYLGQLPGGYRPRSVIPTPALDREYRANAISPVAKLRAIGKDDGTLVVENMDGGPARTIPASAPDRMLHVLSFSPDGQTLAVAENDIMHTGSVLAIWHVSPGKPPVVKLRHTLRGGTQGTLSLDWFADNKTLISANEDNTVRLWACDSGKEIGCFYPEHTFAGLWDLPVYCVATSPDGRTFVTWACDGLLKLWDKDSFQLLRSMETRGSVPCALAFTPDGKSLQATDRNATLRFTIHPNPIIFIVLFSLTAGLFLWMFWTRKLFSDRDVAG